MLATPDATLTTSVVEVAGITSQAAPARIFSTAAQATISCLAVAVMT